MAYSQIVHDNLTSMATMRAAHALGVQETHEDVDQLVVRSRPGAWLKTEGHIIDKAGVERGARSQDGVALHANWLQKRLFEIAQWCLDNNEPCRLLVYKSPPVGQRQRARRAALLPRLVNAGLLVEPAAAVELPAHGRRNG